MVENCKSARSPEALGSVPIKNILIIWAQTCFFVFVLGPKLTFLIFRKFTGPNCDCNKASYVFLTETLVFFVLNGGVERSGVAWGRKE